MNLDFLSGLLLTAVVLAIVYFVARELLGDERSGNRNARQFFTHALERLSGGDTKPVNEHLIGSVGQVISHSTDVERPMRVRLGAESWPARLNSAEENPVPVGNAVEVVAVDGAILVVGTDGDAKKPPTDS